MTIHDRGYASDCQSLNRREHPYCSSPEHLLNCRVFFGSAAGPLTGGALGLNSLAAKGKDEQGKR